MFLSTLLAHLRSQEALGSSQQIQAPARTDAVELVRCHYDFIWRLLRRMGLSETDADDATQQVFLVTLARKDLHINSGSERSFLFGVALRVRKEFNKAHARAAKHDSDALERLTTRRTPDEQAEKRQAWERLERILEEMAEDVRAVFVLYEFEGMTSPEVADLMGTPVGTVASRLRRGREIFHQGIEKLKTEMGVGAAP